MYPRTNYQMSEADLKSLLESCKPVPYLVVGGHATSSPQENANRAWAELGKRMGFDSDTVQPLEGKSAMHFSAVPTENETQRAERMELESIEAKRANIERLEKEVEEAKSRLAAALA